VERIEELFGRLAQLDAEELQELQTLITEQAGAIEGNSPEEVAVLVGLADKLDATREAITAYETASVQAEQDAAAARARIAGEPANTEATAEQPVGDEGDEEPEAEPEAETAEEPALVAGGSRIRRMAAANGKAKPSPETVEPRSGATLVASAALGNIGGPQGVIEDPDELAVAMSRLLEGMPKNAPPRGRVLCASATWEYPEERRIDARTIDSKFAAALGPRGFLSLPPQALVASGGICAPLEVDFSVPGWSTADRPLRDGLPAFQADRGGLVYIQPGNIATYSGATEIWTEATDANPLGATKPVVQVVCGTTETVYVNAVPTRLGFGNMTARFAPEQTAANTDLAMSMAARTAENELLQLIAAQCVADVTTATTLGATRDLLVAILQVVAGYRNAYRIPDTVKFTAIFPAWLKAELKADLVREIGHSQNAYYDALQITDEYLEQILSNAGVNPIWHIDGQSAAQLSSAGDVAQVFAAQAASGAVNTFPGKVVWYVFPEGAFQFLDSGRLDLGVVRDSTLDATNDYEVFVETFEGIAFRGFSSGALQMVSSLCANGSTAGTIATTGDCA
jgi:hypothetical protein